MSDKVTFQGIRCTDTRLSIVWHQLLTILGVTNYKDDIHRAAGFHYDAITIPGGFGLVEDRSWLYRKSTALIKAHQNEVVILTAHDDCAAKGNYNQFIENLVEYRSSLIKDGIECTALAFFFSKGPYEWLVHPLSAYKHVLNVVCKYRNLDRSVLENDVRWLFKNPIPGFD